MPVEKSAGAVIFRKEPSFAKATEGKEYKIYYLLLHYPSSAKAQKDYWDFPKGHVETEEKELDTVRREVKEETGIENFEFIEGFKEGIKYFFKFEGKTIFKIVTFYLVETKTDEIKISGEHIGYEWLPFQSAIEKLTFKNAKEILKKANEYLKEQETRNKEQ